MTQPRTHIPLLSTRRELLARSGGGFGALALSYLLTRDALASRTADAAPRRGVHRGPHFQPRARSVIWLFMNGGVSHMETFDPKPELTKHAGKTIGETPYKDTQSPEKLKLARVVVINDEMARRLLSNPVIESYRIVASSPSLRFEDVP